MADPRDDILPLIPQLRAYARTLAAGQTDLADDVVQDTLVLALQNWDHFTPGTNLHAWLFRILLNRFRTVVGRKHRTTEVADDELGPLAAIPALQEQGPELADFKRAFARLSPSHRSVLVLRAVQGLPYDQIAAICGCEVGMVKSRINRARMLLKAMLLGGDAPAYRAASRLAPRAPPAAPGRHGTLA